MCWKCSEYFVLVFWVTIQSQKCLTEDELYELVNNYGPVIDVSDAESEDSNSKSKNDENSEVIQHVSDSFSQDILLNICNDETELYSDVYNDSWCEIDEQPDYQYLKNNSVVL